jgi:hypothetical protein
MCTEPFAIQTQSVNVPPVSIATRIGSDPVAEDFGERVWRLRGIREQTWQIYHLQQVGLHSMPPEKFLWA